MGVFLSGTGAEWVAVIVTVGGSIIGLIYGGIRWLMEIDELGLNNKTRIDDVVLKVNSIIEKDADREKAIARIDAGVQILLKRNGLS